MLLTLEDVNAYYGKSHILHDVSMAVDHNEIVALLGRNGAGKTTTCRAIMGSTVSRVEGSISVEGKEITEKPPDKVFQHGITWIPERRRLFPNLTVKENLRMGLTDSSEREKRFEEIFDLFPRLNERLEQKAGTLSGGEQQMTAIARALVSNPKLLLIDEPFEGLMPRLVDDVSKALTKLGKQDVAMLVTDQQTTKTLNLADRAYVMETGRIKFGGEADELQSNEDVQEKYLGV